MTIPSSKYLKNKADRRLSEGREPQKVLLVYAAITLISALLVSGVRYALADQISHTGGLQNIGTRSVLATADNVLPILQTILLMCLDLGYLAAMLRIGRRQYASPMTLKAGVERFGVLLRSRLLMGLFYFVTCMASFYLAIMLFMISPFSENFMAMAQPLVSGGSYDPNMLLNDEVLLAAIMRTLIPYFIIYGIVLLIGLLPIIYRYRMVDYLLIDRPQEGAAMALRRSKLMMRGNFWALLRLDLSFWWYYLLQTLVSFLLYLDVLLPAVGISFPFSDTIGFFLALVVYSAAEFAVLYFFRNKLAVTYALAYDSLVPKEQPQGMVLGNIFQMQE